MYKTFTLGKTSTNVKKIWHKKIENNDNKMFITIAWEIESQT